MTILWTFSRLKLICNSPSRLSIWLHFTCTSISVNWPNVVGLNTFAWYKQKVCPSWRLPYVLWLWKISFLEDKWTFLAGVHCFINWIQMLQSLYDQICISCWFSLTELLRLQTKRGEGICALLPLSQSAVELWKLVSNFCAVSKRSVFFDVIALQNSCMSSMSKSWSLSSDCKEKDEIVTLIQSIFRAHLARTVLLEER